MTSFNGIVRCRGIALLVFCAALTGSAFAQSPGRGRGGPAQAPVTRSDNSGQAGNGSASGLAPLPADAVTHHVLSLPTGELRFSATAGTIRLSNAQSGAPVAAIGFIAFQREGGDPRSRPVTFVFNGGPGYASAWLDLGALGPWRLPMSGDAVAPSAAPLLSDNTETWLDFTDLVFIDPAGTGYSRILGNDDVRKSLWSVNGDIDSLATTIRRWAEANNRLVSPKFIAGESYGGFRAPKVARELTQDQGIGVKGLALISPVLDFGRFNGQYNPLNDVARLPSYVATAREAKGPITRESLRDVEDYAKGAFLADLLNGVNDSTAVQRLSDKVATLTGLDAALVKRFGGRLPSDVFRHEIDRADGRVASAYDGTVSGLDPTPFAERSQSPDQIRIGLHAPLTEAMVDLYRNKLNWIVEGGRYQFLNEQASRQWDYGRGDAEAIRDLRSDLALDPGLRVLIAHGLTDLVTPYFETQMLSDQIPSYGDKPRLELQVYPGGHMLYTRDASRRALHDDAQRLVEGK